MIYKEKFERIFGEQAACAEEAGFHEDAEALRELETYMIGTTAWVKRDELGYIVTDGADWMGKLVTHTREHELRRAEMCELLDKRDFVLDTMRWLALHDKRGAYLLEQQYMNGKKVAAVRSTA